MIYFYLATFWKPEACGQTVLPDWMHRCTRCDILGYFQTLCSTAAPFTFSGHMHINHEIHWRLDKVTPLVWVTYAIWGRPPWPLRPPRLSAKMRYLRWQKIMEGSNFLMFQHSQNLLNDLDLGRWPQIRPPRSLVAENRKIADWLIT